MNEHERFMLYAGLHRREAGPPSIAEYAEAAGVCLRTAQRWLDGLVNSGLLQKAVGQARAYRPTDAGRRIAGL